MSGNGLCLDKQFIQGTSNKMTVKYLSTSVVRARTLTEVSLRGQNKRTCPAYMSQRFMTANEMAFINVNFASSNPIYSLTSPQCYLMLTQV
jgi:hypothetical protein